MKYLIALEINSNWNKSGVCLHDKTQQDFGYVPGCMTKDSPETEKETHKHL